MVTGKKLVKILVLNVCHDAGSPLKLSACRGIVLLLFCHGCWVSTSSDWCAVSFVILLYLCYFCFDCWAQEIGESKFVINIYVSWLSDLSQKRFTNLRQCISSHAMGLACPDFVRLQAKSEEFLSVCVEFQVRKLLVE